MDKVLTISIAAFNAQETIERTLDSLICDDELMELLEVFVIDDGGTDNTKSLVQKYVERYPDTFIFVHKENGGHGSTINYSVHHATAKYFKMLDGDDWLEKGSLEKLLKYLMSQDADIVLSPYKRIYMPDETEERVNRHSLEIGDVYSFYDILDGRLEFLHAAETTVKTEILKANYHDITEKCVFTDDEYIFNLSRSIENIVKTDFDVYCYRIGIEGQTVSIEGRLRHLHDGGRVACAMLEACRGISESIRRDYLYKLIANTLAFQLSTYFLLDDFDEMCACFDKLEERVKELDPDFLSRYFYDNTSYTLKSRIESINKLDKNIVIVGAGQYGKKAADLLKNKEHIVCFADNSKTVIGSKIKGIEVKSVEECADSFTDAVFYISSIKNYDAFVNQLTALGVDDSRIV